MASAKAIAFSRCLLQTKNVARLPSPSPVGPSSLQQRAFSSTPRVLGLEEFFDSPQGWLWHKDLGNFGRGWTASELRQKSFDDLHKLWYVCLKEKNRLASQKDEARRFGKSVPDRNEGRNRAVATTMSGIKQVLWERHLAFKDARAVLEKAKAAEAATPDSPYVDPDVEALMTTAFKKYEAEDLKKRMIAAGLGDQIPRKPKLQPKKRRRTTRLGPVLIDHVYIIEEAAKYGFKNLSASTSEDRAEAAEQAESVEGEVVEGEPAKAEGAETVKEGSSPR